MEKIIKEMAEFYDSMEWLNRRKYDDFIGDSSLCLLFKEKFLNNIDLKILRKRIEKKIF